MAYAYVYSPVSGQIWSRECYCRYAGCPDVPPCGAGCEHTKVGGSLYCCPIDIGDGLGEGTLIRFRGSSNIQSIKVNHIGNVCGDTNLHPWTDGVKVQLYAQPYAVCWFGAVLYGHLQNRQIAHGTVLNRPSTGWNTITIPPLGELPADCRCGCSDGIHIHMEGRDGTPTGLGCDSPVYTTTWLYRWDIVTPC